ncbi:DUF983 domain-containing protein [Tritonibacter mobilis]|uniref:Zinc-finger protein n=1 Tax=Tritonibacter mobilis F1926 TaxID=1265309 RepID=A0A1B0ZZG0_9RHOB|nr:DUF983 domain-containing protein [Tritonibacter mobilis]ANP39720.1 hypothetical protein K529_002970 [Tritonibacter mobilis F1926]KJZ23903.1 zinc-finger protein [Tritonibacter mobilis]MBU3036337.1 DUF983 domain-containing protein [Tritonibacter mobilis]WHQ83089.1 DUF983 domain-containing protein [Tritonibacter mobilis]
MTDTQGLTPQKAPIHEDRPTKPALWKGWRGRCPKCGEGKLLHSYLKVNDSCSNCGEEFHHHRADDGPAYLTILIVGHLMAPLMHYMAFEWRPSPWVMASVFSTGCLAASLYLLPHLKGVVVAYQWARRMHGFDKTSEQKTSAA